jgi:arginyl-tRNA synthetase
MATKKKSEKKRTEKEQEALQKKSSRQYWVDVRRTSQSNHIWLNAFSCIRPTDEFKLQLADSILRMLQQEENTIKSKHARPGYIFEDLDQRELVIRINKS